MRAWASKGGYTVDLDRETFRFINHAHQNDRRCRDWVAAWRNWIDIAQEKRGRDSSASKYAPGSDPHLKPGATYDPEKVI